MFAFWDTIQLTLDNGAKGTLVLIDLEKAYDLTYWSLFWRMMEKVGYPLDIISVIKSTYPHT